jgi:glycine/D-amino acid oxidase-like deaminating enzyme
MTERHYEYIVVGKGLMGAAAARHLSAHSPSIALIGPDEPPDRPAHVGVFGSHYDEGGITRILDPDRIWALFAHRSMVRYRDVVFCPTVARNQVASMTGVARPSDQGRRGRRMWLTRRSPRGIRAARRARTACHRVKHRR